MADNSWRMRGGLHAVVMNAYICPKLEWQISKTSIRVIRVIRAHLWAALSATTQEWHSLLSADIADMALCMEPSQLQYKLANYKLISDCAQWMFKTTSLRGRALLGNKMADCMQSPFDSGRMCCERELFERTEQVHLARVNSRKPHRWWHQT